MTVPRSVGARQDPPTLPIPVQQPPPHRRRRRRLLVALVVVIVLAILAVIAFVVGDRVLRSSAETQIEQSVAKSLPDGITGKVDATIGGGSALLQWLRGSFDAVTLHSDGLRVAGAPATAVVHLTGLPVDGGAVERATATLAVGQAAFKDVPALRNAGASAPKLRDGTVSTTLTRTLLGLELKVAVVLKPSLSGQTVRLKPTSATLTAGPASIPATAIVQQLLPDGVSICAASYLPDGIDVTSVRVKKGEAVVGLSGTDVDLNALDSTGTRTCG